MGPHISCPTCRSKTLLQAGGGVSDLAPAFLINNLLKLAQDSDASMPDGIPCKKHDDRVRDVYCEACDALLCSLCVIDHGRRRSEHVCVPVAHVAVKHRKQIEDQLGLLTQDITRVDSIIAQVDSAKERVIYEGNETRKAINETVEQLRKKNLIAMLDQKIDEKVRNLLERREKCVNVVTYMNGSKTRVEERLKKLKDNGQITAVRV